jgi:predicted permease
MRRDLLFSLRALRRSPLFTAAAVLSLALGIGANMAIFSLLDQVVLRSLPVRDPERLVVLHTSYKNAPGTKSSDNSESVFSYAMYRDLRDRDTAFDGLAARMSGSVRVGWEGNTVAARAEVVSGNFFSVLGVGSARGRVLAPEDDGAPGAHPVAVLGHAFWTAQFGAAPAAVGRTLLISGQPFVVVGVVEPRFQGLIQGDTPDLFVPVAMHDAAGITGAAWLEDRSMHWLNLFGRLKTGEAPARAQADIDVVYRALVQSEAAPQGSRFTSERDRADFLGQRAELRPAAQGISVLRERWEKPLRVVMIMVALVLLIACANVAGLMLARAAGRRREIAIRIAIGAGRAALVRQLLAEGLLLAFAGGALGLPVYRWSTAVLLRMLPQGALAGWIAPQWNLRLLGFTLAVSAASGLLFSAIPAFQATRPNLVDSLRTQFAAAGGMEHGRLRPAMVTGQLALSVLLVVGAALFSASAANLLHANLGFRAQHLLTFDVDATLERRDLASTLAFYRDLNARLAALPGTVAVTEAAGGPFSGSYRSRNLTLEGYRPAEGERVVATVQAAAPGYFRALEIPLRAGREFTERDTAAAPKAVIVDEAFARKYFAGQNPVGRRLMFGASNHPVLDREIVGIVADSRTGTHDPASETVYMPCDQLEQPTRLTFYVRASGNDAALPAAIRRAVREAAPNLPVPEIKSVELRIRESLYSERLIAALAGAFGALATLLSAIGLYGVMAYSVARRTAEIGVRMALGALPAGVLRMILMEAGRVAAIGIAIGLASAFALSRLVESQLFGIHAANPRIYAGVAVLLGLVALLAAFAPGWRASRVHPAAALKYE